LQATVLLQIHQESGKYQIWNQSIRFVHS
jgi:hypothetical protein